MGRIYINSNIGPAATGGSGGTERFFDQRGLIGAGGKGSGEGQGQGGCSGYSKAASLFRELLLSYQPSRD